MVILKPIVDQIINFGGVGEFSRNRFFPYNQPFSTRNNLIKYTVTEYHIILVNIMINI